MTLAKLASSWANNHIGDRICFQKFYLKFFVFLCFHFGWRFCHRDKINYTQIPHKKSSSTAFNARIYYLKVAWATEVGAGSSWFFHLLSTTFSFVSWGAKARKKFHMTKFLMLMSFLVKWKKNKNNNMKFNNGKKKLSSAAEIVEFMTNFYSVNIFPGFVLRKFFRSLWHRIESFPSFECNEVFVFVQYGGELKLKSWVEEFKWKFIFFKVSSLKFSLKLRWVSGGGGGCRRK